MIFKNYFIICVFLTFFSYFQMIAMEDDVDMATRRIELLLSPWVDRIDEATEYMSEAIRSNSIQEVIEETKGMKVKTIFYPETKKVDLQVGSLYESMEFNTFIRWLDTTPKKEKQSKKFLSKRLISRCILQ